MANIGIIGWGYVGSATGEGFATNNKNKIFAYDKFKKTPNSLDEVIEKSDFIFLCLPTPMFRDYTGMDMGIISRVVDEISPRLSGSNKIVIVKSTVLPGTTAGFAKKFPKVDFAMSPEFLTQKNATADFLHPSRTVIGATNRNVALKVKKLYQTIIPKDSVVFLTDTTSAELTKYMSNLMLATKVIISNEFYFLAKDLGVNYDGVRKMVEADKRIGTFLKVPGWDGDYGFGQACFPKDMLGLLSFAKQRGIDMSALDAVWEKNLKIRKHRDWEHKENAFGLGAGKNVKMEKQSNGEAKTRLSL